MTRTKRLACTIFVALALTLSLTATVSAQIQGRVTTIHGVPVEAALVSEAASGASTATDARGDFVLPGVEAPALLLIQHPRFDDYAQELTEIPNQPLTISLVAKQSVYEEIVVSARRGGDSLSPSSIASTVIEPLAIGHPTTTLTDSVIRVPGVAENGQGGLFQVVSIRGVSRNRVLTLIDGMRIISERRAGTSTSFLDPLLIGSVDVLRGPASTFYGSGALGGVMQLFPVADHGSWLATGYKTDGDERYLSGGWSGGGWSLAMAARSADNGEAPDGSELATGFDQLSAVLAKSWQAGGLSYDLSLLPTVGRDIQKSSTDFPGRPTVYPEENHLLARFSVASEEGWRVYAFAHPNDLQTRTTRLGDRVNMVDNEAFDFGLNGAQELELALWQATARLGVEYFGRRGVKAVETEIDLDGDLPIEVLNTLDGQEDELAAYGSLRRNFGKASVEIGGRYSWLQQGNAGTANRTDSALAAFTGVTVPLGSGFELAGSLGTGLRFPSLSERFFTGTTGRGGVIGNPQLDPERSLNADLALRWYGKRLFVAGSVFRNQIDDYIERIEIEPDLLTYVNLTSGRIEGFELEGSYQATQSWHLSWSAHRLRGRDDDGAALADVPVDSLRLGSQHRLGAWTFEGDLDLRAAKDDPGSGETEIGSAQLLSAAVTRRFDDRWALTVSGSNLLDEEYRRSADDKAPLAAGRSFGVAVRLGAR